ncbi:hypothetical protein VTK73DRAFT_1096 [Phialemonium thermophilum]|uniref:HNH nuclease domain-containing protein n=1 Tax=Phialemonium thermophilum TaxID=223376 RepID=A0ABR3VTY4_9PEZI
MADPKDPHTPPEQRSSAPESIQRVTPRTPSRTAPAYPPGSGRSGRSATDLPSSPLSINKIRSHLSGDAQASVGAGADDLEREKRSFSEISATYAREAAAHAAKRAKGSSDEIDAAMHRAADKLVQAHLDYHKAALRKAEGDLAILKKDYADGLASLTAAQYANAVRDLEVEIGNERSTVVTLHHSKYVIAADALTDLALNKAVSVPSWSYIDLLISRYRTPRRAREVLQVHRKQDKQAQFRADVLRSYSAQRGDLTAFCVVSGKFWPKSFVRAAHIVRHNVGEVPAEHIFGPAPDGKGHIWHPSNGLPMLQIYEELFDDGEIAIVPDTTVAGGWKVVFFDPQYASTLQQDEDCPYGSQLHERRLTFRSDFRPRARYLYYAFCINMLRRQRHAVPGWNVDRMTYGLRDVWASPTKYLRTSTLQLLACEIAQLLPGEAEKLFPRPDCVDGEEEEKEMPEVDESVSEHCTQEALADVTKSTYVRTLSNKFALLGRDVSDDDDDNGDGNNDDRGEVQDEQDQSGAGDAGASAVEEEDREDTDDQTDEGSSDDGDRVKDEGGEDDRDDRED